MAVVRRDGRRMTAKRKPMPQNPRFRLRHFQIDDRVAGSAPAERKWRVSVQTQYTLHGNTTCAAQWRLDSASRRDGASSLPARATSPAATAAALCARRSATDAQPSRRTAQASSTTSSITTHARATRRWRRRAPARGLPTARCSGMPRRRRRSARTRRSPARSCWRCRRMRS